MQIKLYLNTQDPNPNYFHELASKPYFELKEGLRCSEAINTKCKRIIKPVWDKWNSHRVWTPAKYRKEHGVGHIGETIKGMGYYLPYLERGFYSFRYFIK